MLRNFSRVCRGRLRRQRPGHLPHGHGRVASLFSGSSGGGSEQEEEEEHKAYLVGEHTFASGIHNWEVFMNDAFVDHGKLGIFGLLELGSTILVLKSQEDHASTFDHEAFVTGAADAWLQVYRYMHDQDFVNFVAGHTEDDELAAALEGMASPRVYETLRATMEAADQAGQRWEVQEADVRLAKIHRLHLHSFANSLQRRLVFDKKGFVDDGGAASQELHDAMQDGQTFQDLFMRADPSETEYWLEADVRIETYEEMTLSSAEDGDQATERENEAIISFLGCIEGPEELRWVITNIG